MENRDAYSLPTSNAARWDDSNTKLKPTSCFCLSRETVVRCYSLRRNSLVNLKAAHTKGLVKSLDFPTQFPALSFQFFKRFLPLLSLELKNCSQSTQVADSACCTTPRLHRAESAWQTMRSCCDEHANHNPSALQFVRMRYSFDTSSDLSDLRCHDVYEFL
jgi:hypothetical protein